MASPLEKLGSVVAIEEKAAIVLLLHREDRATATRVREALGLGRRMTSWSLHRLVVQDVVEATLEGDETTYRLTRLGRSIAQRLADRHAPA